jgi:hypothetical protein
MIWLKRLLPFVLIAAAWFGYDYYRKQQFAAEVSQAKKIARVTSRLWLANAELRPDSAAFLAYRDSLLTSNGLTLGSIDTFMAEVHSEPQKHDTFSVLLTYYVDSLAHYKPDTTRVDTIAVDTTASDSL